MIPEIGDELIFSGEFENLSVGETVYYIADVIDQLGENKKSRTITIYGLITENNRDGLKIIVSSIIWDTAPSLTLILSNDSDTVVKVGDEKWLVSKDNPIVVSARAFIGASEDASADIACLPSDATLWTQNSAIEGALGIYQYENSTLTINKMPDDFETGGFVFSWTQNGITITRTFSLKKIV
jgi:hypothetical protein